VVAYARKTGGRTAEELTRRAELPITWDNQQRELGIGLGNPSN
jgi:hypothetical protein